MERFHPMMKYGNFIEVYNYPGYERVCFPPNLFNCKTAQFASWIDRHHVGFFVPNDPMLTLLPLWMFWVRIEAHLYLKSRAYRVCQINDYEMTSIICDILATKISNLGTFVGDENAVVRFLTPIKLRMYFLYFFHHVHLAW